MYNENCSKNEMPTGTPLKQPMLAEALLQFKNQNDWADDVSMSIREKLSVILNWEKVNDRLMDKIPEPVVSSAVDEFNYQLKRQKDLNERLSDILLHLREII